MCGKPHCLGESDKEGRYICPVLRTGGTLLHTKLGLISCGHEELPTGHSTGRREKASQGFSNLEREAGRAD